jgi:hypothetical protein
MICAIKKIVEKRAALPAKLVRFLNVWLSLPCWGRGMKDEIIR